ncbi:hypothetical protein [Treponema sp.]|uniref:hypothetical protein n=1 Tax=Treponema sp. TaxID=166 RepID=UPI003890309A
MNLKVICILLFCISFPLFSVPFSFQKEAENWINATKDNEEGVNFIGPFLRCHYQIEKNLCSEVECFLESLDKKDWITIVRRNFETSFFSISILTQNGKNVDSTTFYIEKGEIIKSEELLKNYNLSKLLFVEKKNYYYHIDSNVADASNYYIFVMKNEILYSYAYYGNNYSKKDIDEIIKIKERIGKNAYELVSYLLSF